YQGGMRSSVAALGKLMNHLANLAAASSCRAARFIEATLYSELHKKEGSRHLAFGCQLEVRIGSDSTKLSVSTTSLLSPPTAARKQTSEKRRSGPRLCEKSHRCYDSPCESAGGGEGCQAS